MAESVLEIGQLNSLGTAYARLGVTADVIRAFQRGIRLADGTQIPEGSLKLRIGLALMYLLVRRNLLANEMVLWAALVYGEALLSATLSTEVRQQKASGHPPDSSRNARVALCRKRKITRR